MMDSSCQPKAAGAASPTSPIEFDFPDTLSATTLSEALSGIDRCIRQWKAARHHGQSVLTSLSNTLLLRTYVDKGQSSIDATAVGGCSSASVWGALAGAGQSVPRISIATESRARRLHSELAALQEAMLTAAWGIRRHAEDARRLHSFCDARKSVPFSSRSAKVADVTRDRHGRNGSQSAMNMKYPSCSPSKDCPDVRSADESSRMASGCNPGQRKNIIGGGYGLGDLADCAAEVYDMLMKEGLVTSTVVHGVVELVAKGDREGLTMYSAAWQMQPYVDTGRLTELQTMVGGKRGG